MSSIPPKAREAMALARRGDLEEAIQTGEAALADAPGDGGLRWFIGMLHARRLDFDRAVPHLQQATRLMDGHPLARLELIRILIAAGRLDEAAATIAGTGVSGAAELELARLDALLHERRGDHRRAAALLRTIVARDGNDAESWGRLGGCLLALGDSTGATASFDRALLLAPDRHDLALKRAEARVATGAGEAALVEARATAGARPSDPMSLVIQARIEDLLERPADATASLRSALALDPDCEPALLSLADLLERDNCIDEFETVVERLGALDEPPPALCLLRARLALRKGDFEAARRLARVAPSSIDPGTRARLLGEAADRLGDAEAAFAAFAEMNRLTAREAADPAAAAAAYRGQISALGARITPEWYAGWWKPRPAPVFLFGFPRSGTTLLDTFLAGHPGTLVLEEKPVLKAAADALGDPARLPMIGHDEIVTLRQAYYDALDAIAPAAAEAELVVDKLPLGIADTALAHRLFPNARFIFVERHPCDVVLSGYMTRFDPRGGMANFLTLEDLAELYDVTMEHWRRCREVFPLDVHTIRYERLVADPEGELRPLAGFLGIEWTPRLLDHRASAKARAFIGTPSYAQVGEPIYSRASGRWRRYRRFIEPVLPKLLPWAERMDYPI